MANKSYRSVKTIFEKVKMGEFAEEYSASPRLFSNFEYNTKSELVKPYLHYIDEKALQAGVQNYILQEKSINEIANIAKMFNRNLSAPESLGKEMQQLWYKFPKTIINDIYNIYYNDIEDLEFSDRTVRNKSRYQLLDKSSNPTLKVITNHNNIKSMIFTRSMIQYYLAMMAMLQQENYEEFKEMVQQLKDAGSDGDGLEPEDSGNGSGEQESDANGTSKPGKGNNQKSTKEILDSLKKRFDEGSSASKPILDKVIQDAKLSSKIIDEVMSKEEQEQLWDDLGSKSKMRMEEASKRTDAYHLLNIKKQLKTVTINMRNVNGKIKHLLDRSMSYFNEKSLPVYENILEADSLDGLEDYILLHPKLRNLFINDIYVKDTKKIGKLNIYIDVSGSMGANSGLLDKDGKQISKELFSKAFTFKMKELNLLNNVYSFQSNVKAEGNTLYHILNIGGGGGTNLTKVIEHIEKTKSNSIILTDAEDACLLYSKYAYFIGVAGSKFHYFNKTVLEEYVDRKQLIMYDGVRTYEISKKGTIIK